MTRSWTRSVTSCIASGATFARPKSTKPTPPSTTATRGRIDLLVGDLGAVEERERPPGAAEERLVDLLRRQIGRGERLAAEDEQRIVVDRCGGGHDLARGEARALARGA